MKKDLPTPKTPGLSQAPLRATLFTSRYYYALHVRIWNLVLLSLALDLVFLFTITPWSTPHAFINSLHLVLFAMGLTAIVGKLFRDTIIDALFTARGAQDNLLHRNKYGVWIALGALLLITFLEIAYKTGASPVSLVMAVVVTIGAIKPIRKALKERAEKARQSQQDRTFWVEQSNFALFTISLLPLVAARIFALTATLLAVLESWPWWANLLYWIASLVIILTMQPHLSDYTFSCKRCGMLTSRSLRRIGFCPLCAEVSGVNSFAVTGTTSNYGAPNKNLETLPPIDPRAADVPLSVPELLRGWLKRFPPSSGRRKS